MLDVWVPAEHTRWVKADDVVDVSEFLPGVRIDVLGPPTLQQVPKLRSYASGSAEYWLGLAADGKIEPELQATVPDPEFQHAKEIVAAPGGLGRAAWLLDELHDTGARQVLDIVAGFDDVLNNTSVVLLVSIGERTLLFGGDAQVENWSYPLDRAYGANDQKKDEKLRDRLANVDLYKVGHHGSRNATPRRLVELWRTARTPDRPLCSVLSTRDGVYGTVAEGKVPKQELIERAEGAGQPVQHRGSQGRCLVVRSRGVDQQSRSRVHLRRTGSGLTEHGVRADAQQHRDRQQPARPIMRQPAIPPGETGECDDHERGVAGRHHQRHTPASS